jgi:hypothetical protein
MGAQRFLAGLDGASEHSFDWAKAGTFVQAAASMSFSDLAVRRGDMDRSTMIETGMRDSTQLMLGRTSSFRLSAKPRGPERSFAARSTPPWDAMGY